MAHSLLQNQHAHLSDLEELTWAHGKHQLHVEQTFAVSFPLFAQLLDISAQPHKPYAIGPHPSSYIP